MKKKFFIGLFIAAVIGLGAYASFVFKQVPEYKQNNIKAPIEIPAEGIQQIKGNWEIKKPAVILFYVDWCGFCRKFMPIFGEAAAKYNKDFDFFVLNCEVPENEKFIQEYNVNGFPTIFIKDNDLEFEYELNNYATVNIESFGKELEKHLKLRAKLKK